MLLLVPVVIAAQTLDGAVDYGYGRATYDSDGNRTSTGAFTQGYTLGYRSALWDPRFLTYSGELTFHRNALTFGSQDGRSRQTGFRTTATLFGQRPLRASVRASRGSGGESANYPDSSSLRGGLGLPAGSTPELRTGKSEFGVNLQLTAKSLPRVEVSYERDSGRIAAGSLEAVQQRRSIQALVAREGPRLSNTLRYQRNAFENDVSQAFWQRDTDLGYELLAKATARTWGTVRAGRRTTHSRFEIPRQFTSSGFGDYRPPPGGAVALYYGQATLTHQAVTGLSADMSVGFDRERTTSGSTSAMLASATTRYVAPGGVSVRGSAVVGERGQEAAGDRVRVLTRAITAGAEYRLTSRLARINVASEAGRGWNRSDRGIDGASRLWRGRADLGTDVLRRVQLNIGYEKGRSIDDLLPFGNDALERTRASARASLTTRLTVSADGESASIDRGLAPLLVRNRYMQAATTLALDLSRERRVFVTAGRFISRLDAERDRNDYLGLAFNGIVARVLQVTTTIRRERTMASVSRLDQDGYYTTSVLDYRLRLFTFGFEHRYTNLLLSTASRLDPLMFAGNQIQFRVTRKLGFTR